MRAEIARAQSARPGRRRASDPGDAEWDPIEPRHAAPQTARAQASRGAARGGERHSSCLSIRHRFPRLLRIFAAGADAGPQLAAAFEGKGRWRLEAVKRAPFRAGVQSVVSALGGGADAGVAGPQPAVGQGLRDACRDGPDMALSRQRPNPAAKADTPEKTTTYSKTDSEAQASARGGGEADAGEGPGRRRRRATHGPSRRPAGGVGDVDGAHGRVETRVASVAHDVAWPRDGHGRSGLAAIGEATATRETRTGTRTGNATARSTDPRTSRSCAEWRRASPATNPARTRCAANSSEPDGKPLPARNGTSCRKPKCDRPAPPRRSA